MFGCSLGIARFRDRKPVPAPSRWTRWCLWPTCLATQPTCAPAPRAAIADHGAEILVGDDDGNLHDRLQQRGSRLAASLLEGHGTGDLKGHLGGVVPLANMFGYATDLRSSTQGRGQYSMEPHSYEEIGTATW